MTQRLNFDVAPILTSTLCLQADLIETLQSFLDSFPTSSDTQIESLIAIRKALRNVKGEESPEDYDDDVRTRIAAVREELKDEDPFGLED